MRRFIIVCFVFAALGAFGSVAFAIGVLYHFGRDLPEYQQLAEYQPPVTTRIHAGDGRLLAEYAKENRLFVPIEVIPPMVREAFISAEDKNFYEHPGIDVVGLLRAVVTNVRAMADNRRPVGGSTITQQVAKNFLLTNEVSISRKVKEAILAFRIERALSKDRILELYLNEIYLGARSYGVAAAAMNYFNKSLDDLTLSEAAFLAALPKAPNNYDPVTRHDAAVDRRNWVIHRLLDDGKISEPVARQAIAEPLVTRDRNETEFVTAGWYAEEVRREIAERFGADQLYGGGLSVRTSVDPKLQGIADRALRKGLTEYDRRHGYRGSIAKIDAGTGWIDRLNEVEKPAGLVDMRLAVVLGVEKRSATVGFLDGSTGEIGWSGLDWARPWRPHQRVGPAPSHASQFLSAGDVVAVEGTGDDLALGQIPDINGALVAMDPYTGRVLAMTGGYSDERSKFNRATQALRQPGSAFKPFVYLAALESGLTPATLVLDAPFELRQPGSGDVWRPQNYSGRYYGPTPMRTGLEKSRNLMTVRLAEHVGMDKIVQYARNYGIDPNMQPVLSMALGAGETTVLRLTTAYAMLANGGMPIEATLIDRVQDRTGKTIFRHDQRPCQHCNGPDLVTDHVPLPPDNREPINDPKSIYQVVSMLEGVIDHGTGARQKIEGKVLAGKTGTTNDSNDSWFMGFSSDLVVGVFTGFDQPRTLGPHEAGSTVAAPVFGAFMREALKDRQAPPFRVPPGMRFVRISRATGLPPVYGDTDVTMETFKPGNEPSQLGPVVGAQMPDSSGEFNPPPSSFDSYGPGTSAYGSRTGTYGSSSGSYGRSGSEEAAPNVGGLY